jgi:hypothetical protein
MDFDEILGRVLRTVEGDAFMTPASGIEDPRERELVSRILEQLDPDGFDVEGVRAQVRRLQQSDQITLRRQAILLQTVAAHPAVRDLREVARQIGVEEYETLAEGGPLLARRLAVLDHHRAVLAWLMGRLEVALDLETRSVEATPGSDSLANILAILLRLGEEDRARELLARLRASFPTALVDDVERYIQQDPDLTLLRDVVPTREEGVPCDSLLH